MTDSLTTVFVDHIPEELEQGKLYVSERFRVAIHLCACGCGHQTVTPFAFGGHGWEYTRDGDLVALNPSIGNFQFPCRSHYFIRRNRVEWV